MENKKSRPQPYLGLAMLIIMGLALNVPSLAFLLPTASVLLDFFLIILVVFGLVFTKIIEYAEKNYPDKVQQLRDAMDKHFRSVTLTDRLVHWFNRLVHVLVVASLFHLSFPVFASIYGILVVTIWILSYHLIQKTKK